MTEAAQVLERRDNVVFLHREGWNYFNEKPPETEGWYVITGTSDDGIWYGIFELVEDSLIGSVDHPNPWPVAYHRLPPPPEF